jgi:hypothetical protein
LTCAAHPKRGSNLNHVFLKITRSSQQALALEPEHYNTLWSAGDAALVGLK